MNLIDINNIILGNKIIEVKQSNIIKNYYSDIIYCLSNFSSYCNIKHMDGTKSYKEFYESNPMFDAIISDYIGKNDNKFKKELFFSMVCNCYIEGYSMEFVALLKKAIKECKSPNRAIRSIDKSKMEKFLLNPCNDDPKYIKNLLDYLYGYNVNLITEFNIMVTNKNIVEIYIDNVDNVLLANESIKTVLTSVDDIKDLFYDKNKGVIIKNGGVILRKLIDTFGIVTDDMDLRTVVSLNELQRNI